MTRILREIRSPITILDPFKHLNFKEIKYDNKFPMMHRT